MRPAPFSRAMGFRLAAGTIVVGYGVGAFVIARGPGATASYPGLWKLGAVLAGASCLALVVAAVATTIRQPATRSGELALAGMAAWLAPFWAAWDGGPATVRATAAAAGAFATPLLAHTVLSYPTGRLPAGGPRALVVAMYLAAATTAVGLALVRDPFLDPNCFADCTSHGVVVYSAPGLAHAITTAGRWFALVAAVILCVVCALGLARSTPVFRRGPGLLLAVGAVIGIAGAWRAALLLRTPLEGPLDAAFRAAFAASCAALATLAVALAGNLGRQLAQRHAVRSIVADLGARPPTGTLGPTLARALGDPELRIAYPLPGERRYVDAAGRAVEPPVAARGRSVTTLTRARRPLATVAHSARADDLERELGPAVRLALENERLHAEVLAQLVDLRASRARVVATADAARRRLERDLHDGAQQRLLALTYDLRVAQGAAERARDPDVANLLAQAAAETQAAVQDLRDVARGIYPAILVEAGLATALATFADTAPIKVEVAAAPTRRHPSEVEAAAYNVVTRAVHDAGRRGASRARVIARDDSDRLEITIVDDGSADRSAPTPVVDRVGAVGGRLVIDGDSLRAEIPCA